MNSQEDAIVCHTRQDGTAVLQVNRPQARNALNWEAQERFAACVDAARVDERIRVLIITGAGSDAFAAGGDLKEIHQDHDQASGRRLNRVMSEALSELRRLPFPVVAAINGNAFGGGCEIITACDLRIAREQSQFSFAQVRNGLTTGWGGAARLVQLIGLSRASELLLSGRVIDAREAYQIGLLHRLVPQTADVMAAATEWATELAELPAGSLASLKALLYAAVELPPDEVQRMETSLFMEQWASPDHLEALAAFEEKRRPIFNQTQTE